MNTAIVREPSPNFGDGLTTADLGAPDYALMRVQHAAYVDTLSSLGVKVEVLDPLPQYPDSVFIEDTAVVLPEIAVLARSGAPTRRGEATTVEAVLAAHRPIERIKAPGMLDGGDVIVIGTHLFIGISERTNQIGAQQLGTIAGTHGYTWNTVPVGAGLHLKSDANALDHRTLLTTPDLATQGVFDGYDLLVVAEADAYACNVLNVNGTVLLPSGFADVERLVCDRGFVVHRLKMSEARKMDGGLTCLSLRF